MALNGNPYLPSMFVFSRGEVAMVKFVSFAGPGNAYLAVFRRDTSPITADVHACFLVRKDEIVAVSDRDFELLKIAGHVRDGQLTEATPVE
jgi:hypothetical protein